MILPTSFSTNEILPLRSEHWGTTFIAALRIHPDLVDLPHPFVSSIHDFLDISPAVDALMGLAYGPEPAVFGVINCANADCILSVAANSVPDDGGVHLNGD